MVDIWGYFTDMPGRYYHAGRAPTSMVSITLQRFIFNLNYEWIELTGHGLPDWKWNTTPADSPVVEVL